MSFSLHLRNAVSEVLALRCGIAIDTGADTWKSVDCSFPTLFSDCRSWRLGQRWSCRCKGRRLYDHEHVESFRRHGHWSPTTEQRQTRGHGCGRRCTRDASVDSALLAVAKHSPSHTIAPPRIAAIRSGGDMNVKAQIAT